MRKTMIAAATSAVLAIGAPGSCSTHTEPSCETDVPDGYAHVGDVVVRPNAEEVTAQFGLIAELNGTQPNGKVWHIKDPNIHLGASISGQKLLSSGSVRVENAGGKPIYVCDSRQKAFVKLDAYQGERSGHDVTLGGTEVTLKFYVEQ